MTAIDDAPHLEVRSASERAGRVIDLAAIRRGVSRACTVSSLHVVGRREQFGATIVTFALHSLVRDDATRQDFLALTTRSDR
jgi:alkylation response protein AidB-like acyl-CoA dehydrogenase